MKTETEIQNQIDLAAKDQVLTLVVGGSMESQLEGYLTSFKDGAEYGRKLERELILGMLHDTNYPGYSENWVELLESDLKEAE